MRSAIVPVLTLAVVTAAFASAPSGTRAGQVELRPRCGAHGWVMGVLDSSRIYFGREVDKPAEPERGNPSAQWPSRSDRSATGTVETDPRYGATASVVARFVVDTVGCVDSSTFTVVEATDSAFSRSVRRNLSRLRYRPARKSGQKVRSWVLWKFVFEHRAGAATPF